MLTIPQLILSFYMLAEGVILAMNAIADFIRWLEKMGVMDDINAIMGVFVELIDELKREIGPFVEYVGKELVKAFNDAKDAIERIDEEMPWLRELLKGLLIVIGALVILLTAGFIIAILVAVIVIAKLVQGISYLIQKSLDFGDTIERVVMRKVGDLVDLFKELKEEIEGAGKAFKESPLGKGAEAVGNVGSKIGGVLPIPFAEGGIVSKPTFALIGENGPEAVIPLNQNTGSINGVGTTINTNDTININVTAEGGMTEPELDLLVDKIVDKIVEAKMNQYSSLENKAVFG